MKYFTVEFTKAKPKTETTKNVIEIKQRISDYEAKQKGSDIPQLFPASPDIPSTY